MKSRANWKDLLILFKSEKRALFVFGVLLISIFTLKYFWNTTRVSSTFNVEKFERAIASLDSLEKAKKAKEIVALDPIISTLDTVDINTVEVSEWTKLGFSDKQAQVIIKYKNMIKGFERKEDLLDVFIISDSLYKTIEPYLVCNEITQNDRAIEPKIEASEDPNKGCKDYSQNVSRIIPAHSNKNELLVKKDINSLDSIELIGIRGIGPYSASKILRYRRQLGGYVNLDQLKEVKAIRPKNFEIFSEGFFVDSSKVTKININTCSFSELLKHPYFDYYFTKKIFEYREENGKITSLPDLMKIEFIDSVYFNRIGPYLRIN